jgi:RimJ/RimL family protein N-acetyltransferase
MKICKESLILKNESIYLRPLQVKDITDEYVNGLNDPEVNKYLVNVRLKIQTFKSVEKYVQSNMHDPHAILFGIFIENKPKTLIGTVHVSNLDFFHFMAAIGICLFSKRVWNKGYAVKALKMAKEYLLGTIGLHYLESGVYAENTNSIKLFTRAGFSEIYRVNNKFRHVDSFKEVIHFGIINPLFDMSLLKQNNLYDGLIKT